MFSDPQFWVAVAFVAFIAAIFNPVRKILTSSLDTQIKYIKNKIDEKAALEEKELSKWLNKSESELKIQYGQPDIVEFLKTKKCQVTQVLFKEQHKIYN